ncbi:MULTISPECIES: hypothetical protein [Streptomyces]|uniref:hypothetical protein n=1 Tax=Streptomyces TaxID=1883 RepID=UPI0013BD9129|nr:hypothetical protein [Streptomyces sp. SID14446]NEB27633.1 hypothetical protein [Streptomyces sp. SID14446]
MSDDPFPGIIEVRFVDASGHRWSVIDKTAVFTRAELTSGSVYPVEVTVACAILGTAGRPTDGIVTVSLAPDGVTTPDGRDTFNVDSSQLIR